MTGHTDKSLKTNYLRTEQKLNFLEVSGKRPYKAMRRWSRLS